MMRIIILFFGFVYLLQICACTRPQEDLLLFDFESEQELDQFEWECKTLVSLSNAHNTHGTKSLKIELYPSQYPGISTQFKLKHLQYYRAFTCDMFNPTKKNYVVSICIDDRVNSKDDSERFSQNFILHPGMNHLRIPFASIRTAGTQRQLNLSAVLNLVLFLD